LVFSEDGQLSFDGLVGGDDLLKSLSLVFKIELSLKSYEENLFVYTSNSVISISDLFIGVSGRLEGFSVVVHGSQGGVLLVLLFKFSQSVGLGGNGGVKKVDIIRVAEISVLESLEEISTTVFAKSGFLDNMRICYKKTLP